MQVKEAIKYLKELNPESEIVAAWWSKDLVEQWVDTSVLNDDQWSNVVSRYEEGEFAWQSDAAETLRDLGNEILEENN
jgi:hypothetical protein